MSKFILSVKKHYKAFIIYGLIDIVIGISIFLVFYFAINVKTFIGAIDGVGVAGAILLAAFIFVWLSRNGAFDTMSYGFSQLFSSNRYILLVYSLKLHESSSVNGPT